MLECARGCLEQGGRQLLRLPREKIQKGRLGSAFWSHGAIELDLPAYWLSALSAVTDDHTSRSTNGSRQLAAGIGGNGFLPFLYPEKTLGLLRRIVARGAQSRHKWQKGVRGTGARLYARKAGRKSRQHDNADIWVDRALQSRDSDTKRLGQAWSPGVYRETTPSAQSTRATAVGEDEHTMPEHYKNEPKSSVETPDLNSLKTLRRQYHSALVELNRTEQEVHLSDFTERVHGTSKYTRLAEQTYGLGDILMERAGSAITHYLRNEKSKDDWTDDDWRIQAQILGRQATLEPFPDQVICAGLDAGKASIIMPALVEALISQPRNGWDTYWPFYRAYERWRSSLEQEVRHRTPEFWDHLLQVRTINAATLSDRAKTLGEEMIIWKTTEHRDSIIDCALNLILVTIKYPKFGDLPPTLTKQVYNHLRGLLQYNPNYEKLRVFLSAVLFAHSTQDRVIHGVEAYQLFLMMNQFGGYRGEQGKSTDLARKLFWRLCYSGTSADKDHLSRNTAERVQRIRKVFENIRSRNADHAPDYSAMLFRLSQAGRAEEYDESGSHYAAFLEKKFNRRQVGQRSAQEMYHDRIDMYRRRNDLQQVLRIFEEMLQDPEVEPSVGSYNLVISALARAGDLDEARGWFLKLTAAGLQPDAHTYAPFMKVFAYRGDVERVRFISREMETKGIALGDAAVQAHVQALLQAGELNEAEDLVWRSKNFIVTDRAALWNLLVGAYALQGNTDKVRRLLSYMRGQNIPFTVVTFVHRLRLWCNRRRPEKAEQILQQDMPAAGVPAVALHYGVVMKGYADLGQYRAALRIFKLMQRRHVKSDWSVKLILSKILRQSKAAKLQLQPKVLHEYHRIAASIDPSDLAAGGPLVTHYGDGIDEAYSAAYFQFMTSITPGNTELERVEQAWDLYIKFVHGQNESDVDFLPAISVSSRVMKAYRRRRIWNKVTRYWTLIETKARQLLVRSEDNSIIQSRRYILCAPLFTYLKALSDQELTGTVGRALIGSLLKSGFALDNRCWNQFIRGLVVGGSQQYLLAFEIAEATIMPGWRGWPSKKKKEEQRAHEQSLSIREKLLYYANHRSTKRSAEGELPLQYVSALLDDDSTYTVAEGMSKLESDNVSVSEFAVSDEALDKLHIDTEEARESHTHQAPSGQFSCLGADELSVFQSSQGPEGSYLRRPEYSTLVHLTRAFLDTRIGAAFETNADDKIRQLSLVAPTVIQAILTMPRLDDNLQLTMLRRQ